MNKNGITDYSVVDDTTGPFGGEEGEKKLEPYKSWTYESW